MTVANVIDVMTDDQHCNSCALGKAKMPATPTGKTIRPSRKVVNSKMYVDLSGTLRKHRSTMVFTIIVTIFNEAGTPHTVQIDGEGTFVNEVVADWFASKQVHVVKTETGQHFRNGNVECRHRIWKGMARAMIDRTGFSIEWWYSNRIIFVISTPC